jgi:hypothetical protein
MLQCSIVLRKRRFSQRIKMTVADGPFENRVSVVLRANARAG